MGLTFFLDKFFSSFSKSYIIGKVNELRMSTEKREDGPGEHSDTFSCVPSTRVGMASPSLDIETILISTKFVLFVQNIYQVSVLVCTDLAVYTVARMFM